jgi:hypothetical protein
MTTLEEFASGVVLDLSENKVENTVCPWCAYHADTALHLKLHLDGGYNNKGEFCPGYGRYAHLGMGLKCEFCKTLFNTEADLELHLAAWGRFPHQDFLDKAHLETEDVQDKLHGGADRVVREIAAILRGLNRR